MPNEKVLSVNNLGVKLDGKEILKNVSFEVADGDVLAIVGPNGAGKSVLFRTLLGLVPHTGDYQWQKDIKVNYIPQRFTIDKEFPLTVKEFMEFKTKDHKQMMESLAAVGLTDEHHIQHHVMNQRLGWLSGGQLQRVLIAWALLDNPKVILFDEPTAGVDVEGEETIYNMIKKLHKDKHLTILLISHDLNIVYRYATSVVCLNKNMICYGIPTEALDSEALKKLYGEETTVYSHHHDHK